MYAVDGKVGLVMGLGLGASGGKPSVTAVHPRKIRGAWAAGYMLDLHSTGSTLLGHDQLGHPQFDTRRTEVGELLFRLKYRSDETAVSELTDAAERFIRNWRIQFSAVVPVPPTRTYRKLQPVTRLAVEVAGRFGVPALTAAIRKLKQFSELKDIYDPTERRTLLDGAFQVNRLLIRDQRILLIDDLYRSGATLNAITEALRRSGASVVYPFAFTQTRRNT